MKILLIAYEFPPILAAQALRWFYLSNELVKIGVEVEVICPNIYSENTFPVEMDERIKLHRVWPGPFIGLSQELGRRLRGKDKVSQGKISSKSSLAFSGYRMLRSILDNIFYPDVRSEWYPFALRKMKKLLKSRRFDAVVSSYEPGVDIFIGYHAHIFNIPWTIDMADPLLTPYSPRWRRGLDLRVERKAILTAKSIIVTAPSVLDLLKERHGRDITRKFSIVPQGFSDRQVAAQCLKNTSSFDLIFTGNFYKDFRNPCELAKALEMLQDLNISFTIAGNNSEFESYFKNINRVNFLGQRSHFDCLNLQGTADLLVNIGNVQNYQIPGKIYEYLGARKPILHIKTGTGSDIGADLIQSTGAGFVVDNNAEDIQKILRDIYRQWINDPEELINNRKEEIIETNSWSHRAKMYKESLQKMIEEKS